jgi:hypothetical protein
MNMQVLSNEEISLVHGGEVGATHMADDYHYDGPADIWLNILGCVAGAPEACVRLFQIYRSM